MNAFNRIVVILLALVLLAACLALAIFPAEAVQTLERAVNGLSTFITNADKSYHTLYMLGRVALVVLALLIFGGLLVMELRRKAPGTVRVHTEAGSSATVTAESVARRLAWHIDQLADVISVTPQVTARGNSVNVRLDLETRPEVDVPMKTDEVVGVAREVITERMGLQLGKIDVRINHAPYQDGV
jgi:hypothetical protein